jgi:predicted peptidase
MTQFAAGFSATVQKTVRFAYLLSLPSGYGLDPLGRWPLVLSLHGAGERGEDIELVKTHGIPKLAGQGVDFPFIALAPQCPVDSTWWDEADALIALLDEVAATYAVDPDRLLLTGYSLGGYGTWHLATQHPHRFAAIAPICGGGLWFNGFPERVQVLKHLPVWAFHGAHDDLVPLDESAKMVQVLQERHGNVRFTIFPDAGHDCWTRVYDDPEFYDWLLSHSR